MELPTVELTPEEIAYIDLAVTTEPDFDEEDRDLLIGWELTGKALAKAIQDHIGDRDQNDRDMILTSMLRYLKEFNPDCKYCW